MAIKTICGLLISIVCCATVFGQQKYTANEAADFVQHQRDIADSLIDVKSTPAQLERAVKILERAITFLDSIPIRQLAYHNKYLYYRMSDANCDLASGYAMLGRKEDALNALDKMFENGCPSNSVKSLGNEPTLDPIRQEPRYKALIQKLKKQGALWKNTSFETPYKPNLSDVEKQAGLALLWSQAKFNFVNFNYADVDWNQTYLDYIPKVQQTNSTAEYYHVLVSFYAKLHDGHTNVYYPKALSGQFYSRPPMRAELIEGRVFIVKVFSDSLYKSGIVPGIEILKIDGTPVKDYAEKYVEPYQSASTPQDMDIRKYAYGLFSGDEHKPLDIEFKTKEGKIFQRQITRTGYNDIKSTKALEYQVIDEVSYIAINGFEDNKITAQFDSLYTQIEKTKGLIIDLRYNGGGDDGIGFNIIRHLTDKPFFASSSKVLDINSVPGAEAEWLNNGPGLWSAKRKIVYTKPVIVLIGPRTYSAAEDFVVAFDYMKRGKLVGMPTGGSTGQPVPFNLPGGGSARVCGKHDSYPDGKEFVGIGIMPDVKVIPTIKDLQNGYDAQKEAAIKMLKN